MKFEVNITEEDYLKFNYYHHFHSKAGKKLIFGMRIAVPMLLLVIEVTDLLKGVDRVMFWYNVVFMTVFTVIWEIIVNPVMKHSIRFSIKNMKNADLQELVDAPHMNSVAANAVYKYYH